MDDGSDHLFVSYDFGTGWNTLSLTYDDNGNLTVDGLRKYGYDAWNRLVKACYSSGDLTDSGQLVGDYEYDGKNRRLQRIVANRGSGVWNADTDGTYRYFYQTTESIQGSGLSLRATASRGDSDIHGTRCREMPSNSRTVGRHSRFRLRPSILILRPPEKKKGKVHFIGRTLRHLIDGYGRLTAPP